MKEEKFTELDQYENGTPNDKIILIKSVYKNGKRTIQPSFDEDSGSWAGVDRVTDEDKKKLKYFVTVGNVGPDERLNTTVVLKAGLEFDLSKELDALNWKWVKHDTSLAMSHEQAQSGKAEFYVHIVGRESEQSNKSDELMFDALQCVMKDATTELSNRALLLGFDMSDEPPATVKQFLLSTAKKNPKSILNVYRNKSMRINLLFVKAKQRGIITVNNTDSVIKYGVTILGVSDESAIAYLQQNEDILELLQREVDPNSVNVTPSNPSESAPDLLTSFENKGKSKK
tara:strand:- start:555 stop:1412 length:858 start_codon:yes stop_codon:yes gene_type:complete